MIAYNISLKWAVVFKNNMVFKQKYRHIVNNIINVKTDFNF